MSPLFPQLDHELLMCRNQGFLSFTNFCKHSSLDSLGNWTYEVDWFISAIFSTSLSLDHQRICPLLGRIKKNEWKKRGGGDPTGTNVSQMWRFYSIRGTSSYHPHFRLLLFVIRVGTRRLEKVSISQHNMSDVETSPEYLQGPLRTVELISF